MSGRVLHKGGVCVCLYFRQIGLHWTTLFPWVIGCIETRYFTPIVLLCLTHSIIFCLSIVISFYLSEITLALEHLHSNGIIYRSVVMI